MSAFAQLVHDHLDIRDSAIFVHGLSVLHKKWFCANNFSHKCQLSHSRATGKLHPDNTVWLMAPQE